jgi:hypothetical protein
LFLLISHLKDEDQSGGKEREVERKMGEVEDLGKEERERKKV